MPETTDLFLREQLLDRRQRLQSALAAKPASYNLGQLLEDVDSALQRFENGTYGICAFCHEPVEKERLLADPLVRYCLDHLTPAERTALEYDLQLAAQVQREMLPKAHLQFAGWEVFYHYQPLGPVSGDYCDILTPDREGDSLFFVLGDASGKGVAASMLMAHLHAIFRTLVAERLPVNELVERAGRVFRESNLSPYFATLVCGRASASGHIELSNAGHCPPLVLHDGAVARLEVTGMPLGLFSEGRYSSETLKLGAGGSILLHTDGLCEARNRADEEYGENRLADVASNHRGLAPAQLVSACLEEAAAFRSGAPLTDDVTIMAIRRVV